MVTIAEEKDVLGAILPVEDDLDVNDFAWMDAIEKDDRFMPFELSNSRTGKSLDFGEGGVTGSLSTWHELLQITAPDAQCGLVFVRGDFPDNPESILARAQRRNQKGTIGLGIGVADDADWVQEATLVQGMVNLRWPLTRLNWVQMDRRFGSIHFASYTACSFVKDGIVYQIGRILPTRLSTSASESEDDESEFGDWTQRVFTIDVGGVLRFGCPSSAANRTSSGIERRPVTPPFYDKYTVTPNDGQKAYVFTCTSAVHEKRLEIRLWVDRDPIPLELHACKSPRLRQWDHAQEFPDEVSGLHIKHNVKFHQNKSMVIIATYALVDAKSSLVTDPCRPIKYAEVRDYLGVADPSGLVPYRLFRNLIKPSSSLETFEVESIGRAVESTLGVALLPVAGCTRSPPCSASLSTRVESPLKEQNYASDHDAPSSSEEARAVTQSHLLSATNDPRQNQVLEHTPATALLKNIITPQVVDMESTLWQVRLLVQMAVLLKTQPDSMDHLEGSDGNRGNREVMQRQYLERILSSLRGICRWVLSSVSPLHDPNPGLCIQDPEVGILASDVLPTPLEQRKCRPWQCPTWSHHCTRATCKHDPKGLWGETRENQKYFCVTIVWYTLKHLPEIFHDPSCRHALWSSVSHFSDVQTIDQTSIAAIDEPTRCLIRWYHAFSFGKICEYLRQQDGPGFQNLNIDFADIRDQSKYWQIKAENEIGLYEEGRRGQCILSPDAANLASIGAELGVRGAPLAQGGKSCFDAAQLQIRQRSATAKLSPGRSRVLRWDLKPPGSIIPRRAPWELSCLAQFAPINLAITEGRKETLEACKEFMTREYSFMSSWDYSMATTIGQWWDFATSSVICARLLIDEYSKAKRDSKEEEVPSRDPIHYVGPDASLTVEQVHRCLRDGSGLGCDKQVVDLLNIILAMQKEKKPLSGVPFEWKARKPKMPYHADTEVQSLEDTPAVYTLKQTSMVKNRSNIAKYLLGIPASGWSLDSIKERVGPSKLHHLSCLDFALTADRNDMPEISNAFVAGRANMSFSFWKRWDNRELIDSFRKDPSLTDLYFIGRPTEHPEFGRYPEYLQRLLKDGDRKDLLLAQYQESLFQVLNDSLVDQGIKYRVLFVTHLSPATVQALIYMWHPDALDMFDDYLGEVSNFFDTTNQSETGGEGNWITSITIMHWRLEDESQSTVRRIERSVDMEESVKRAKAIGDRHEYARYGVRTQHGEFPPRNVVDSRRRAIAAIEGDQHHLTKIHELALSLAITGDEKGRNWTCSIVCELFDEQQVKNYTSEVTQILQQFIHQQDTARMLVFLHLLGYVCERLAEQCDNFTREIDGIMDMNPSVLLEGMEWHRQDLASKKLQTMLWGLEALRVYLRKLASALQEIDNAGKSMISKIGKQGAECRHRDMVLAIESVQEQFDKRHGRLQNAKSSIEERIDQGSKLKNGIESVLSAISAEQNENIGMLAWLTILYLPATFVVDVFSMGRRFIPEEAGWSYFGRTLAAFMVATLVLAVSLQFVIKYLRDAGWFVRRVLRPKVIPIQRFITGLRDSRNNPPRYVQGPRAEGHASIRDVEAGSQW